MTESSGRGDAARVLVIKLGALGDFVQALAPAAAIRRHHAGARITLLTTAPFAGLAGAAPYFDEVWVDDCPPWWRPGGWLGLRRRLRAGRFDRIYDLQTSDRAAFYFRLLGPGRRPEWSGIAPGCSHPHANPGRDAMHTMDRQAEQLAMAGIGAVPAPDLAWLDGDASRFGLAPPTVLLVPGGSAHRPAKRWPAARYGALAATLAGRGYGVAVLGGPEDATLAAAIRAACPGARDLTGSTGLADIPALARGAAGAVGNDTGPMHLIAAVGCPALVLFSADSDPALCAPRGPAAGTVAILRQDSLTALAAEDVEAALLLRS